MSKVLLLAECPEAQGSPIRVYEDGKVGVYDHAGHELRLVTAEDIPADLATEALGLSADLFERSAEGYGHHGGESYEYPKALRKAARRVREAEAGKAGDHEGEA